MIFWSLLISDYRKYKKYGGSFGSIVFFTQGFWAIIQYRLAHAVFQMRFPVVKQLLQAIMLVWQKIIELSTGISIPASVTIGHSFYIGHFGGIILNANAIIGNNCNIAQGVTIGVSGKGSKRGVPTIGNDVYLGASAILAGNIKVGNNVLIGACSLVTTDVGDYSVMLGVPAIKISEKGSEGYI